MIRSQLKKQKYGACTNMLSPCDIMMWICSFGAKKCATALLKGKTGLIVDLNVPMKSGFYPLHHAAKNLSPDLTDLFLQCGARTDLCCYILGSKHHGMLPLSVALEAICSHQYLSDWDPTKSIFVLIYILCMPEMKCPLETIELLAENTEDLKLISTFKAREGRLIELAALLCVAWKKLLVPVTNEGVDSSIIGRCILERLSSLIGLEVGLINTGRDEELRKCRKMKDVMLSASLMLHVYYRAGDVIYHYRHSLFIYGTGLDFSLARSLICLFKELGFALKKEDTKIDDINCFYPRIDPKKEGELRSSIACLLDSKSSLRGKAEGSVSVRGRNRNFKLISNDFSITSQVCPATPRSFHTCHLPIYRSIPKLYTHVGTHHTNTSELLGESTMFSATRRMFCARALTFTRRIRCA